MDIGFNTTMEFSGGNMLMRATCTISGAVRASLKREKKISVDLFCWSHFIEVLMRADVMLSAVI